MMKKKALFNGIYGHIKRKAATIAGLAREVDKPRAELAFVPEDVLEEPEVIKAPGNSFYMPELPPEYYS